MKNEEVYYVIMKIGDIELDKETVYISANEASEFTNDIRMASRFRSRKAALSFKYDFDLNKNHGYESDMKIIPVKVTYEW